MTEGIIDREEEPAVAALGHDGFRQARGERVAVIDPGGFGRRARLAGKGGAAYSSRDHNSVFLGAKRGDCKRDGGMVEPDRHIDLADIKPFARDGRTNIGLVLMIAGYDLDRLAEHGAAEILDRHLCCDHRARTAQISVEPGLIVEHADLDDIVGNLRTRLVRGQTRDQ